MAEKRKILVIEDSPVIVGMLVFMLEREDYETMVAEDGRKAMEILQGSLVPDAVILDILLSYVDGFELLAEMRRLPAWQKVPVIVLSAKSHENDVVRALDLGADDYLVKPLRPRELAARLRRFFRAAP